MVLGRQAFTELLGPLRELLDRNLGLRVLHSVPALKALSPSDAENVLALFQSVSFAGGQTLLSVGQRYSTLFVVKSGAVRITKGKDAGDSFLVVAGAFAGEWLDNVRRVCFVSFYVRVRRGYGRWWVLWRASAGRRRGVRLFRHCGGLRGMFRAG
jgi:CRP-like cAMP-binding protein